MSPKTEHVLQEALRLPPDARAAIAGSLIESLDETVDEDSEATWSAEIARRMKELDSNRIAGVPWPEARRRILEAPNG